MIFKQGYLFLTAAFLLASLSAGFAMRENGTGAHAALQTLQTASIQLSNPDYGSDEQTRLLVDEAIRRLKNRMTSNRG